MARSPFNRFVSDLFSPTSPRIAYSSTFVRSKPKASSCHASGLNDIWILGVILVNLSGPCERRLKTAPQDIASLPKPSKHQSACSDSDCVLSSICSLSGQRQERIRGAHELCCQKIENHLSSIPSTSVYDVTAHLLRSYFLSSNASKSCIVGTIHLLPMRVASSG